MEEPSTRGIPDDSAQGAATPGLRLRRELPAQEEIIRDIAWSPSGGLLASASEDGTARLWDTETGTAIAVLEGHTKPVTSVAWSPNGELLASGSDDLYVRSWNIKTGKGSAILKGHTHPVISLAWSPDGRLLASGSEDQTIRLWDVKSGMEVAKLAGHQERVNRLAWSPDSRLLASGSDDETISLWDTKSETPVTTFEGHAGRIASVTWSPDARRLASGSGDGTIQLWDPANEQPTDVLEGHTAEVTSVSFSSDGQLLASKSDDGTFRLWRSEPWRTFSVSPESTSGQWFAGLAFHPSLPVLATLGAEDTVIRIWDLDLDVLLLTPPLLSIQHTTAKIVLVGDSGVGKTGLGWRLAHGDFKEHPSTHGQQFWILDQLQATREDNTECEAVLWDLAGQPDYRLIHGLFLDDAELALILFDPANEKDPMHGVEYWLRKLAHKPGRACRTILVGARLDRGDTTLTEAEIEAFCEDRGITGGYIGTSAKRGDGLNDLLARMKDQVAWEAMTATTTTLTFKRIKDYVLDLKEDAARQGVLAAPAELRARLLAQHPDWDFAPAEMMTAIRHLAAHGYVQVLRTAKGENSILLAPDLLNNLAASFVLEARRNPDGLGALEEHRVLTNAYRFEELAGLDELERAILLDAVRVLFLEYHVCFRGESLAGSTYLIFPELIKQKKPRTADALKLVDDVSYTVSGSVENIYAALVVLLGYTNMFARKNQWQSQAQYDVAEGEICGFRQLQEGEGELDLVLYYTETVRPPTRMLFQGLFERFLSRRNVTVRRYPPLSCVKCRYPQERAEVVKRTLQGHAFLFCSNCGKKNKLLAAGEEIAISDATRRIVDQQQAVATLRTRFEAALVQAGSFIANRKGPTCFISYAWGKPEHERWVEQSLARDLENAGAKVILDRWDNAQIGANISRFVELIDTADATIVVGTPLYLEKYQGEGHVAAAEGDLIAQHLIGSIRHKGRVLPVLLEGDQEVSLPPLMRGRVYADFRDEEAYFATLFDLILSLYDISFHDLAVSDLRENLRLGQLDIGHGSKASGVTSGRKG